MRCHRNGSYPGISCEFPPEKDHPLGFFEAERAVHDVADRVFEDGIGRDLAAAGAPRPVAHRGDERAGDALAPRPTASLEANRPGTDDRAAARRRAPPSPRGAARERLRATPPAAGTASPGGPPNRKG